MNKKNVYLIQIQNPISGKYFLPLSVGYVWTYLQSQKDLADAYRLKDTFIFRDQFQENLESMDDPDVVGISSYIWNWEISKKFAREIKGRWPQCLVIVGGPQPQYSNQTLIENPFFDIVVTFEGEKQFSEILRENLKENPDFSRIPGIITKSAQTQIKSSPISAVDSIESPYLAGFFDRFINLKQYSFNMILETNRGCPYTCTFCDMQDSYYAKVRCFELERIFSELEWASRNRIEFIECADSNFGMFERDVEVVKKIVSLKRETGFPRSFNFTSAKNQPKHVETIQKLLIENGLQRGISISLQSFNPETLKSIRRWNSKPEDLKRKYAFYREQGFESYIELILGLPNESRQSWIEGISEILDSDYNGTILVHPLSIVPNTPFSDPKYADAFELRLTQTRSPAQGFCFGTESPEERETICYASKSMSPDDWIQCYIFSKILVGSYFYHGLLFFVVEFLEREHRIRPSYFFENLLKYATRGDGFVPEEYKTFYRNLTSTLFELRPWGRKVYGPSDMYWSDQAAGAISAIRNFPEFQNSITSFVLGLFPQIDLEQLEDLFAFNFEMLERPGLGKVTSRTFKYDWHSYFNMGHPLRKTQISIFFKRKEFKDEREHALDIYWYGRKSKRCFVKEIGFADIQKSVEHENFQ